MPDEPDQIALLQAQIKALRSAIVGLITRGTMGATLDPDGARWIANGIVNTVPPGEELQRLAAEALRNDLLKLIEVFQGVNRSEREEAERLIRRFLQEDEHH